MTRIRSTPAALLATAALLAFWPAARADFELKDDKGRTILLKDDGTWRYADDAKKDGKDAKDAKGAAKAPPPPPPTAELQLVARADSPVGCQFELMLTNTLPYEIRSLVPDFAVQRANGVVYSQQSVSFGPIKPGDQRQRPLRFSGITCGDIAKLQVVGGDRCEMGDLDRFADAKGACLARVKLMPTDLVKFEKQF